MTMVSPLIEDYIARYGSPLMAARRFTIDLMTDSPADFKRGYNAENALLTVVEQFGDLLEGNEDHLRSVARAYEKLQTLPRTPEQDVAIRMLLLTGFTPRDIGNIPTLDNQIGIQTEGDVVIVNWWVVDGFGKIRFATWEDKRAIDRMFA